MQIISKSVDNITVETYELDINGDRFFYIDYLNEKGKAVNSTLTNEHGEHVDYPLFLQEVQEFIDQENG